MIRIDFDPVDRNNFVLVEKTIEINFGSYNPAGGGGGDMYKVVYDTDDNGIVDNAEQLGGKPPAEYANLIGGLVPSSQLPAVAITEFLGAVANEAAMLALTGELGDWCTRTDNSLTYIITGADPSILSNWTQIVTPGSPVSSVNGYVGVVVLAKVDIGLGNVDNTSDLDKPISNLTQAELDALGIIAIPLQVGELDTDLVAGTNLQYFPALYDFTLLDVAIGVIVAPVGSTLIAGVTKNTIDALSTNASIDAGEKDSFTAAVPPVISTPNFLEGDGVGIDLIQIGASTPGKELTVILYVRKA